MLAVSPRTACSRFMRRDATDHPGREAGNGIRPGAHRPPPGQRHGPDDRYPRLREVAVPISAHLSRKVPNFVLRSGVVELRNTPAVASSLMIDILRLRAGRTLCVPCVAALAGVRERRARSASDAVRTTEGVTTSRLCARCGKLRLTVVVEERPTARAARTTSASPSWRRSAARASRAASKSFFGGYLDNGPRRSRVLMQLRRGGRRGRRLRYGSEDRRAILSGAP